MNESDAQVGLRGTTIIIIISVRHTTTAYNIVVIAQSTRVWAVVWAELVAAAAAASTLQARRHSLSD